MEVKLQLQPMSVPNYVIAMMPPRERQEGMIESPKFHLRELGPEVLAELCDEFRKNVFAKAEKADPAV
jgi:hypothetical protein